MTRDEQVEAIVEHRLAKRRNVKSPDTIREYIRGDLAKLNPAQINAEYHRITGTPTQAKRKEPIATDLDRATSDALHMLPRFTHSQIRFLLCDDYSDTIAGQALAAATEIAEARDALEPPPNSLEQYRNTA
jgi:hypothetical protein